MKLSRKAIRILKWMNRNDDWRFERKIEESCKDYDFRAFAALVDAGYVMGKDFTSESYTECDGTVCTPLEYRITDAGMAFLDGRVAAWLPEIDGWVVVASSVVSTIATIISVVLSILRG